MGVEPFSSRRPDSLCIYLFHILGVLKMTERFYLKISMFATFKTITTKHLLTAAALGYLYEAQ